MMQLEWGADVLSWPEYADLVCRDLSPGWDQNNGPSAQFAHKYCQIHSHAYRGNKQMWVASLFKKGHKITAENEDFPNRQRSQEKAWTCCGTDLDNGSHSWLLTKTCSARTSNFFGWQVRFKTSDVLAKLWKWRTTKRLGWTAQTEGRYINYFPLIQNYFYIVSCSALRKLIVENVIRNLKNKRNTKPWQNTLYRLLHAPH